MKTEVEASDLVEPDAAPNCVSIAPRRAERQI